MNKIEVGERSNIQDNAIVHVARNTADGRPSPTIIGSNVTIGHSATVHACTIGAPPAAGPPALLLLRCRSRRDAAAGAHTRARQQSLTHPLPLTLAPDPCP